MVVLSLAGLSLTRQESLKGSVPVVVLFDIGLEQCGAVRHTVLLFISVCLRAIDFIILYHAPSRHSSRYSAELSCRRLPRLLDR